MLLTALAFKHVPTTTMLTQPLNTALNVIQDVNCAMDQVIHHAPNVK